MKRGERSKERQSRRDEEGAEKQRVAYKEDLRQARRDGGMKRGQRSKERQSRRDEEEAKKKE